MHKLCKFGAYLGLFQCDQNELTSEVKQKFSEHVAKFNLSYGTQEEYNFREGVFAEMDKFIEEENAKGHSYWLGHNHMSTWTREEYNRLLGARAPEGKDAGSDPEPTILDESTI